MRNRIAPFSESAFNDPLCSIPWQVYQIVRFCSTSLTKGTRVIFWEKILDFDDKLTTYSSKEVVELLKKKRNLL